MSNYPPISEKPLALVREIPPDQLLTLATPVLSQRPCWPAASAALGRMGLTGDLNTGAIEATRGDPPGDWSISRYQRDGGALVLTVAVAPAVTALICALRFGGCVRPGIGARSGGAVEAGIAARIAAAVVADLPGNWRVFGDPTGPVSRVTRTLGIDDVRLPGPAIRLDLAGSGLAAQTIAGDRAAWFARLALVGREVRLPLRSVLARPVLSAGELARLAVGDVIPIRAPDRVSLTCGAHHLSLGTLTECDGHAAIRLDPPENRR